MRIISYIREMLPYGAGEKHGVPDTEAERLVSLGLARFHDVEEAVVKAVDEALEAVGLKSGEPLKLTDAERAALPPLELLDPNAPAEMVQGVAPAPATPVAPEADPAPAQTEAQPAPAPVAEAQSPVAAAPAETDEKPAEKAGE